MDFFGFFMPVAIPTAAIGIIAFIIIAIAQEARTGGKSEAIKTAFIYVTSLMTFLISVGAFLFLFQQGLRLALPNAARTNSVYSIPPPTLYLTSSANGPTLYSCTDTCQFTAADKEQFSAWKEQYATWTKNDKTSILERYNTEDKRQTVNALSFLIVALPLYIWFFFRFANGEAKKNASSGQTRPNSLRSAYLYILAFSGLLGAIVSGAFLINTSLQTSFGLSTKGADNRPTPTEIFTKTSPDGFGVRSVIACADKCGFSADEKKLAENWLTDYEQYQKNATTSFPRQSSLQTDLANMLPAFLISLFVFVFHFMTVRRETKHEPIATTS